MPWQSGRLSRRRYVLQANGVQQDAVTTHPVDHGGYVIDSTVAARDIKEGETVLRVPDHLVVTLRG